MDDVEIDLVTGFAQQARFFRKDNKDFVEISFIGNPDTIIQRVTPQVMAQYREAWNSYCDGTPMQRRKGTALTELKEITPERAEELVRRNVHNLEELAVLNDHQCQGLGHGTMTLRRAAQGLVSLRQFKQKEADEKKISSVATKPIPEQNTEIDALKETVKQQAETIAKLVSGIDAIMAKLSEPPPPRLAAVTRKKKNGPKLDTGNNEPSV